MTQTFDPDIEEILGPVPSQRNPTSRQLAFGGAYEGADRFDNSLALWAPPIRSADADILPDKRLADSRSRDVLRNDAYVAAGSAIHKDSIVGAIYLLNARPATTVLGLDETWEQEFQEEVEAKFMLAAESPQHWLDASRMNTVTELIRLAVGVYVAAGETLASVEWLRDGTRPFRTAIQMVDLDRLSNPPAAIDSRRIRGGVERDRYGAPLGYHIRMAHPTDWLDPDAYQWKYVPARKPWGRVQMIHLVEQMRPDQTRGISDMVAALSEMQITKKFRKITLQNAVVNASYAASIESDLPPEAAMAAIGGGNIGEGIVGYADAFLSAVSAYAGNSRHMHIDGVKIPHLFPGTKLQLRPVGQPGGIGTEFEGSLLRYIAANLGVSYEQLSKDYSKTNYSSARAALNETRKFMLSRKKIVADKFATHIYRLWLEEQMNLGLIETLKGAKLPNWYDGMNADAYCACDWIGAGIGQIDELKETQAAVLRLKYNLSTHEDELARFGKDWRRVFAQRQREMADMEFRGLTPDPEDKMMNAASGAPREKSGESEDGRDAALVG